jgi:hypothetical protein
LWLFAPSVGAPNFIKQTLLNIKDIIDPITKILYSQQNLDHSQKKKSTKKHHSLTILYIKGT